MNEAKQALRKQIQELNDWISQQMGKTGSKDLSRGKTGGPSPSPGFKPTLAVRSVNLE